MKCSFCEQTLVCKACGKPFQAPRAEVHVAVYQPDMEISCPACQKLLVCKWCGYVYGEPNDADESGE